MAYIVQQKARLKVVRAIENDGKAAQQFLGILGADVRDDAFDRHPGIDRAKAPLGGHRFRQSLLRVAFLEQRLALQVGRLHEIAIHDAQLADSGANQQVCQCRAQGSAADDHGRGFQQALLSSLADFAEQNLARIAFVGFSIHQAWFSASAGLAFTGCGKTQNAVILSEAKNLSLFPRSKRDSSLRSE